ncbi:MAG: non-canonical purine NTP pyrophosphatase, partial [Candidatus Caldarchaeum sp.]|nr:non-canonical purine NTP pyrophosphatase [Candidatus Caldarchaeum sp.]
MCADRLTFVTSNKHKAEEVAELFRMHGVALNLHFSKTIEIQSENLAEIALFSAIQAFNQLGGPVFVEDAGLFVEELNGFPGPYSSYVYKTLGLEKFLKLIGEDRRAVFRSVICVYGFEDGPRFFVGSVKGRIAWEPRGRHGFGYDPVFIPDGSTKTLA